MWLGECSFVIVWFNASLLLRWTGRALQLGAIFCCEGHLARFCSHYWTRTRYDIGELAIQSPVLFLFVIHSINNLKRMVAAHCSNLNLFYTLFSLVSSLATKLHSNLHGSLLPSSLLVPCSRSILSSVCSLTTLTLCAKRHVTWMEQTLPSCSLTLLFTLV